VKKITPFAATSVVFLESVYHIMFIFYIIVSSIPPEISLSRLLTFPAYENLTW
jgi:hypothetical protein